jgi:thymidylate kinase
VPYYITFDGGSGAGKGEIVLWLEKYLIEKGKRVTVAKDNELDPLRDYGKMMIPWCQKYGVDPQTFLLPLFVTGGKVAEQKLDSFGESDFILRDRSFITSFAYQPAAGTYTPDQVWELCVDHMGFRIPDVAVIVDADVEVAAVRVKWRKKSDIGLGGQMSGSIEKRRRIRQLFLDLPQVFSNRMPMVVIENSDPFTENPDTLRKHLDRSGQRLLNGLREKGVPV